MSEVVTKLECPNCESLAFQIQVNEYDWGKDLTFICNGCNTLFEDQNDIPYHNLKEKIIIEINNPLIIKYWKEFLRDLDIEDYDSQDSLLKLLKDCLFTDIEHTSYNYGRHVDNKYSNEKCRCYSCLSNNYFYEWRVIHFGALDTMLSIM